MNNVLYLTYDGLTDPLGQSQILPYLMGVADAHTKIWIISFEKPHNFERNEGVVRELIKDTAIQWVPLRYTKKPPVLSTLFDMFRMNAKALELHRRHSFKIVHCRSYLSALIGERMKRRDVRLLFDMRGFWADERLDLRAWNIANPLYRTIYNFFKRKERELVRRADWTVVLTTVAREEILSWGNRTDPSTVSVIPCCVDTELFSPDKIDPAERTSVRDVLGITASNRVVIYLGSVETRYRLSEMMAFFKRYCASEPAAKFLFITQSDPELVLAEARSLDIPVARVAITSAARKDVPFLISLADFGMLFLTPSYALKACSPTKLGEMMAMGLPVICNRGIGDTDLIVERHDAGVVIDRFGDVAWDEAIEEIRTHPFVARNIIAGAKATFDLNAAISEYRRIYRALCGATE
jgi:glycosyltransferase involved in cell wall biosynthesis